METSGGGGGYRVLLTCFLQSGDFLSWRTVHRVVMNSAICGFAPSATPPCLALTLDAMGMAGTTAPPREVQFSGLEVWSPNARDPPSFCALTQSTLSSFPGRQ